MRLIKTFVLAIMMLLTGIIGLVHYPLTLIIEWLNRTMVRIMNNTIEEEAEKSRNKLLEQITRGKDGE